MEINFALSKYYTKKQTDDVVESAIDSQKFKTINGEEITGEGNIDIQGGDIDLDDYQKKLFSNENGLYTKENDEEIFIEPGGPATDMFSAIFFGTSGVLTSKQLSPAVKIGGLGERLDDYWIGVTGLNTLPEAVGVVESVEMCLYENGIPKVFARTSDLNVDLNKWYDFADNYPDKESYATLNSVNGWSTGMNIYVIARKVGKSYQFMLSTSNKIEYFSNEYLIKFKTINGESIVGDGDIDIDVTKLKDTNGVITDGTLNWYNKDEIDYENGNIPNDEIWYKTNDGQVITNFPTTSYNVNFVSNTYENGIGKIKFDGELYRIPSNFCYRYSDNLVSIVLPESVVLIDNNFLCRCSLLESVKLPKNSLTTVGDNFIMGNTKLKSIELPKKLKSVGNYFLSGNALTEIKIPYSISSIGTYFLSSNNFNYVEIPETFTNLPNGFLNSCHNLTTVKLPDSVTEIGENFLGACDNLKSVDLGENLERTGLGFLTNCTSLKSIKVGDKITFFHLLSFLTNNNQSGTFYYPASKKDDSVYQGIINSLPSTWKAEAYGESGGGEPEKYVVAIDGEIHADKGYIDVISKKDGSTDVSFLNFKTINGKSIVGGGNIEISGGGASLEEENGVITDGTHNWYNKDYFDNLNYANNIIPNNEIWYKTSNEQVINVPTTGYNVNFVSNSYENGIGKIKFDGDLTNIGGSGFGSGSRYLTNIILPESLTSIGSSFLSTCSNLVNIRLPHGLKTVGSSFLTLCEKLESIELPESLTSMGNSFLSSCSNLRKVKIPKGVITTTNSWFENCYNLESIELPDGLQSIGSNFLSSCGNISSVELPESLTFIGTSFLNRCTYVSKLKIGSSIATFNANSFLYNNSRYGTLYYPSSKKDDAVYQSIIAALPATWTAEPYGPESGSGGGATITENDGILTDGTYEWYDKSKCDLEIAESIEGMQEYVDNKLGDIETLLSRI